MSNTKQRLDWADTRAQNAGNMINDLYWTIPCMSERLTARKRRSLLCTAQRAIRELEVVIHHLTLADVEEP